MFHEVLDAIAIFFIESDNLKELSFNVSALEFSNLCSILYIIIFC